MSLPIPVASFRTTITDKITDSQTTIPIDSVTDDDGNSLDTKVVAMCINKGQPDEETVIGTVDGSGMQLTSVTRGVSVQDGQSSVTVLKKEHRKKSTIEFTAHPFLARLVRIINGTDDVENLIRYASDYTPVLDRDIVTKGYADGLALGGGLTHTKNVIPGTGGETISGLGKLVFFNSADQEYYLSDADVAAEVNAVDLAITMGAGSDGGAISGGILTYGLVEGLSGLTEGDPVFAGETPGEITQTEPTSGTVVRIGTALSTTSMFFEPRAFDIPTNNEKEAMAGTSGTPKSSNKFLTANDVSNRAEITGTGISFTASTKTIGDTGNGFVTAGFQAGQTITVSGTSNNNGNFTIVSVAAGAIVVEEALTDESAGGSFTIVVPIASKVVRSNSSGKIHEDFLQTTDANITTLTGGGNADSLHTHSGVSILTIKASSTTVSSATRAPLLTATLPGGTLGTGNMVYGKLCIDSMSIATGGGGETLTLALQYGSTDVASISIADGNEHVGELEFWVAASGATNTQIGFIRYPGTETLSFYQGVSTGAEDSTGDLELAIDADFSASGAGSVRAHSGFMQIMTA